MNLIFLGLLYTEQSLRETGLYSRHGVQMAPHTFQRTLLDGIRQLDDVRLNVISIPPSGSFPINDQRLWIRKERLEHHTQIGYCNLPWIKHSLQRRTLVKTIKELLHDAEDAEDTLLAAYSPFEPFLHAIGDIKREFPKIQSCLIVTDCIPGRGDLPKNMTWHAKLRGNRIVRLPKPIDRFALLTKNLADTLEIGEKPYVVTECICDETFPLSKTRAVRQNICLYTGSVNEEFNIRELADAFVGMPHAELWICGTGSGAHDLRKMSEKHDNIRYFGFVEQDALQKYRDHCDFLINPRRPTGTYTKYSFPSKTAEYMMSGKPVIMYKLEGVPDAYDRYLNYLHGQTPQEMREDLEAIFAADDAVLAQKALDARTFMMTMKNSRRQAERIVFGTDL